MLVSKKEMQLMSNVESKENSLEIPATNQYCFCSDALSSELMLFGNNKELMELIPDNFIDLIDTDIPYLYKGLKRFVQEAKIPVSHRKNLKSWEKTMTYIYNMTHGCDLHWLVKEIMRVQPNGKVNAYIWCVPKQGRELQELFAKHGVYLSAILTWNKTNPSPADHAYTSDNEYCYYFKQHVTITGNTYTRHHVYLYPNNHAEMNHLGFKVSKAVKHETIKPLFMNRNFIFNSSKPGDNVLDMDAGSGTTGVACKMLDRNFIGMEHLSCYFNLACKRISQSRSDAEKLINYEIGRQERMQSPATVTKKATKAIRRVVNTHTKKVQTKEVQLKVIAQRQQRKHEYYQKRQQLKAKFQHQMKILNKKYNQQRPA